MTSQVYRCLIVLLLFCSTIVSQGAGAEALNQANDGHRWQTVRLGVLANRGKEMCLTEWTPTAEYLSTQLAPTRFEIVPLNFDEVGKAAEERRVEFLLVNPSLYVQLEYHGLVYRIATFQQPSPKGEVPLPLFGGVIFCRADRTDIQSLRDLKGMRFSAVESSSLGGWHAAWREFERAGIRPHRDFAHLGFAGTHDAVVEAVLSGQADGGTVRSTQLERMEMEGRIDLREFRVLVGPLFSPSDYAFLLSTRLYPEWPFAAVKGTDLEMGKAVASALLRMDTDDPAAKASQGAGWAIPQDYASLHECLKELHIHPYENDGRVTLSQAIAQYWVLILGILSVMVVILILAFYAWGTSVRLKESFGALRESELKYRGVVENIQDVFYRVDLEERITLISPSAARLLAYDSVDDLIGRSPDEFWTNPSHRLVLLDELARSGHVKDWEFYAKRRDGSLLTAAASLKLIQDDSGNPLGYEGIWRDVTDRKRAEEALRESNRELQEAVLRANEMAARAEEANAAKSEFLANMSHEIRTPLNGVIGMTGLLLDSDLLPEQRQYAEIVRRSGEALLTVINQILDFSKIEARKLELEILNFDLRITLADTADMLAGTAHEKGLELVCLVDPDVPSLLRGDPGRLRQVVMNLAGNGLKFTQSGEVSIHASLEREDEHSATVRFSVNDTGIGIPRDRLSILFSPFTQVDGSTTRKYGGTGLGLAISKQLAELMGGSIGVESQQGRGSTFWFTAVFEKQPEGLAAVDESCADIEGVNILVVDDNETNRLLATRLLRSWGCRFDEAADADTALAKLRDAAQRADPFEIALLDMLMPEVDGAELGRRIKTTPELAQTRLIMMTSMGQHGEAPRFERIGFSRYLSKPVRPSQLRECLALVMGPKGPVDDTPEKGIITRHTVDEAVKQRTRILLAEDNITNQQVALAILKKLGYGADVVANGREALRALLTIPYDLVLMDCQMPEMDGYETSRRIRDEKSEVLNSKIPIVAMTAHAMKGDREKCLEAGMNDFVAKPVEPGQLAEVLDRWLPGGAAQAKESDTILATKPPGKVVFDGTALLDRLEGDEELLREIVTVFVDDILLQIRDLKESLSSGDAENLSRKAHTIKGACANVGAEALRETAFEAELAAREGRLSVLPPLVEKMESELRELGSLLVRLNIIEGVSRNGI